MAYNKDTGMYDGYIYCIENIDSGEKYIGQTLSTIDKRLIQHKCSANSDNPKYYIHKAIKKYGIDNFTVYEISKVSCLTKSDIKQHLDYLEQFYIKKLNTTVHGFGYNLTDGGNSSCNLVQLAVCQYDLFGNLLREWDSLQHAAECYNVSKQSIWSACNGVTQVCNNYVWRYKGDLFSKFPIGNMAKSRTKHLSNIKQYDYNGNIIKLYTKEELQNTYCESGVHDIFMVCEGRKLHYKNFIWRYECDDFDKYEIKRTANNCNTKRNTIHKDINSGQFKSKKVNCYDKDYVFVKTYNSITDAGIAVGLKNSYNITNVCKHKRNFAGGYRWYYADDISQPDVTKILI